PALRPVPPERGPLPGIVWLLAALKVAIHVVYPREYGFFTDELYFLACGQHLAFGYVDMPPLTAVQAWAARSIFGDSVIGIHLFPALMGAGLVLLVAALARELGGGRFAQGMAALCIVVAPFSHIFFSFLSMNAVEPLVWTGCAFLITRIVRTGNVRLWPWLGLLSGIGLLNKHTMLIFGFAVVVSLAITADLKVMANRWFLLAGLIAFLIFLPNLIWEIRNHFPHLEQLANIRQNRRNVELNVLGFLGQHFLGMHPLALPVWAGGLLWLLFGREGRRYRALGLTWLVTFCILLMTDGRFYYLFPANPMLIAAGAVGAERLLPPGRFGWARRAIPSVLLVTGILLAPILLPILPPETYIAFSKVTGLAQPRIEHRRAMSPLPQLFADRCGWPEMAETVAKVYFSLPPEERAKAAIFGNDYGQSGAIDMYGPKLGLPKSIGGHLTYWLWGPRGYTGEVTIVLGDNREALERLFNRVEAAADVGHRYAMASQHFTVFVCREPKGWTFTEIWPRLKKWD
ncbi:MAG: glycosyltransferase family 39 protein, partial [Thermoanaerobaculia bacterium]